MIYHGWFTHPLKKAPVAWPRTARAYDEPVQPSSAAHRRHQKHTTPPGWPHGVRYVLAARPEKSASPGTPRRPPFLRHLAIVSSSRIRRRRRRRRPIHVHARGCLVLSNHATNESLPPNPQSTLTDSSCCFSTGSRLPRVQPRLIHKATSSKLLWSANSAKASR